MEYANGNQDHVTCPCGNQTHIAGFMRYPELADTDLLRCRRCQRIIDTINSSAVEHRMPVVSGRWAIS